LRGATLCRPSLAPEVYRCIYPDGFVGLHYVPGMDEKRLGPRGGETTVSKTGMIRKNVWLHPDEAEALRSRAYEERRTEAEILREGLRRILGMED
jgi:hypothetical protein